MKNLLISIAILLSTNLSANVVNMAPIINYLLSDSANTELVGIAKIKAYSIDQTQATPTVSDYADTGVSGVNAENLSAMNALVAVRTEQEVDTQEELQALLDSLTAVNTPPLVNAGLDQNVVENENVLLSATASDSDGTVVSYEWKEGAMTLSTESLFLKSDFTLGTHTLTITVTDDDGATATDTVIVTVGVANILPIAHAGNYQTVLVGTSVTLTSSSTDSDGTIVGYEWKEGSTVLSTNASFSKSDFSEGSHTISLTVTDDDGGTNTDTVVITVVSNLAPIAVGYTTGDYKSFISGENVTFESEGSTDYDGSIVSYSWETVTIINDVYSDRRVLSTNPTFTKADFPLGFNLIYLTVTDNDGASAEREVYIWITERVVSEDSSIKCLDKTPGDNFVYNGTAVYTVVDTNTLYQMADDSRNGINRDFVHVCTSHVTTMSGLFEGNYDFNQDIGNWDTSNVTDMDYMFFGARNFNQYIGNWDTSSVIFMNNMFENALVFDQYIGDWDVSSVTNMRRMFYNAFEFNQYLGEWDISKVTTMYEIFVGTHYSHNIADWDTLNPGTVVNRIPYVTVGADINVTEGTTITFYSAAWDVDGTIASYQWKNGVDTLSTESTFSKSDLPVGTHLITLIVTDNKGASSAQAFLTVTVREKRTIHTERDFVTVYYGKPRSLRIVAKDETGKNVAFTVETEGECASTYIDPDDSSRIIIGATGVSVDCNDTITVSSNTFHDANISVKILQKRVMDIGRGLTIAYTDRYVHKGDSIADDDARFFHPITPIESGWYPLGSYIHPLNSDIKNYPMVMIKDYYNEGLLREPDGYTLVWKGTNIDLSTFETTFVSVWLPICSGDFRVMGAVVGTNHDAPSLDAVRCVYKDFAVPGKVGDAVYSDTGSLAATELTVWEINPDNASTDNDQYLAVGSQIACNTRSSNSCEPSAINLLRIPTPLFEKGKNRVPTGLTGPEGYNESDPFPKYISSIRVPFTNIPRLKEDHTNVSFNVYESPFYLIERTDKYVSRTHSLNKSSEDTVGHFTFQKSFDETNSTTQTEESGFSVTAEAGVSFGAFSASISATMSTKLGWDTSNSVSYGTITGETHDYTAVPNGYTEVLQEVTAVSVLDADRTLVPGMTNIGGTTGVEIISFVCTSDECVDELEVILNRD